MAESDNTTAEQAKQELIKAVRESKEVLIEITTPLQLFPVTITLDRAKIVVTKGHFVKSSPVISLSMEDVQNVRAETGMIFGTVRIDEQIIGAEEIYKYGHFWRDDALKFASIAKGFIIAKQKEIDMSPLSNEELAKLLAKIGSSEHVEA